MKLVQISVLLFGCLSYAGLCYGEDSPEENMESKVETEDLPMDQVDHKESYKSRLSKRFRSGANMGYFVGSVIGAGVDFGYLIDAQSQVGFSYASGESDLTGEFESDGSTPAGISTDRLALAANTTLLNYRMFFGNSFNLTLGLGRRIVTAYMELSQSTTSSKISTETESTSIVAQVAIGNQWYWFDGFYLGVDWIGTLVPLSSGYKTSVSTEGAATSIFDDLKEDAVELAKDLGGTASASLLMLSLGWAF